MCGDGQVSTGDTILKHGARKVRRLHDGSLLVFSIFAFTRDIGLKQFGFGLGVAILIDATVIRSILLPASMRSQPERQACSPRFSWR